MVFRFYRTKWAAFSQMSLDFGCMVYSGVFLIKKILELSGILGKINLNLRLTNLFTPFIVYLFLDSGFTSLNRPTRSNAFYHFENGEDKEHPYSSPCIHGQ